MEKYDFDKKFKNFGFDKESVWNAGTGKETPSEETTEQPQQPNPGDANLELNMLKRKFDFLTNNTLKEISERFEELEKKIDGDDSKEQTIKHNRDISQLKNEVAELKQMLTTARLSFGVQPESSEVVIEEKSSASENPEAGKDEFTPGKLKIENFFDCSKK